MRCKTFSTRISWRGVALQLWHDVVSYGGFMLRANSSRRDFLKLAGAGVAGTALSAAASSYARIAGANDRVGVGIVGFSDRFRNSLAPSFLKSAS